VWAAVFDVCKHLHGLSPERPGKTGVDEHGADGVGNGEIDVLSTCIPLGCVGCRPLMADAVLGKAGGESVRDVFAAVVSVQMRPSEEPEAREWVVPECWPSRRELKVQRRRWWPCWQISTLWWDTECTSASRCMCMDPVVVCWYRAASRTS
jgi:hypothetical protein